MFRTRALLPLAVLALFFLPSSLTIAAGGGALATDAGEVVPVEGPWWETTSMDPDRDGISINVERALAQDYRIDEAGRMSVIVDFDHTPTEADMAMLADEVGFEQVWNLHLIDALTGWLPTDQFEATVALPGVVMLELDGELGVALDGAVDEHGVRTVWDDTGYDGHGVSVAVIDTGIDGAHVGLDDLDDDPATHDPKVIAFYDAVNDPTNINGTTPAYDDQGHGSHCAGISSGTGAPDYEFIGAAPGSWLVGVKVLDAGGSGSFATVMGGMQWTVEWREEFDIRLATMSLGGFGIFEWTSSEEDSVNRMANTMVREGVALFIAAGNSGGEGTIGTPGSSEEAITVGATEHDRAIAAYSSKGPTEEGRMKPDIAAIGSDMMSVEANSGSGYIPLSGTSMATPMAAGIAALMLSANPDLDPQQLKLIIEETSTYRRCDADLAWRPCEEDLIPKNRQNRVYGHGFVEADVAVLEAANYLYDLDQTLGVDVMGEPDAEGRIVVRAGETLPLHTNNTPAYVEWRNTSLFMQWQRHTLDGESDHSELWIDPAVLQPGNHTIHLRAVEGTRASTIASVDILVLEAAPVRESSGGLDGATVLIMSLSSLVVVLLLLLIVLGVIFLGRREPMPEEDVPMMADLIDDDGVELMPPAQDALAPV